MNASPTFPEVTLLFSERKQTDAGRSQLDVLLEAAGEIVLRLNAEGQILRTSRRTLEVLSPTIDPVHTLLTELIPVGDRLAVNMALMQTLETGSSHRIKSRLDTAEGSTWFELQLSSYTTEEDDREVLVVGRDISAQQATEEQLRHLVTHDGLTGLPNRALLCDRVHMAIAQAPRLKQGFTLLMMDLDGFKKVNDALGHNVGDELLRIASQRLREVLRSVDTLARVGGDEFVVLLPGIDTEVDVMAMGRRIAAALQSPFDIDDNLLYMTVSIGAAIYPLHGDNQVTLAARADTAMQRAKETGKSRCVIYDQERVRHPEYDVSLEAAMFEAVRNGEFLLNYQPIMESHTRRIVGFEALMRWLHPDLGLVSPAQFIPMAEDNGLINLLGSWALKTACMQARHFEEAAGRPLRISVNVSPRQFRNDHFLSILDEALALSSLPSDQLVLEITEGILMSDPEYAEILLKQISERGIQIAIDDFGTGYSSLAYLKRFPITSLKIDRAFIRDLPASVKDAAICNVVLSLASHLNLSTVAEGVETHAQLDFLEKQGCDLIQGFFVGRPKHPNEVIKMLQAGSTLTNLGVPRA